SAERFVARRSRERSMPACGVTWRLPWATAETPRTFRSWKRCAQRAIRSSPIMLDGRSKNFVVDQLELNLTNSLRYRFVAVAMNVTLHCDKVFDESCRMLHHTPGLSLGNTSAMQSTCG